MPRAKVHDTCEIETTLFICFSLCVSSNFEKDHKNNLSNKKKKAWEKCFSEATLEPILMLHECLYPFPSAGLAVQSEMYQYSEIHNGFLAALLPAAVSLQGNKCTEVQLRVTRMRERWIRVSSACCWRPSLPDIAVTVEIWVSTRKNTTITLCVEEMQLLILIILWSNQSFTNHWYIITRMGHVATCLMSSV